MANPSSTEIQSSASAYLPKKALRIVQEEPESKTVEFGYWTEKTEFDPGLEVEELVISLEVSRESQLLAIEVIKEWLKV
ncbi:MAG: hypothetical protein IPJ40_20765 [Saprospirales bacterium]|nr:hypothetical protein [Saprospirales bacterium]